MIRSALEVAWNSRSPDAVAALYVRDGVRRVMIDPPLVLRGHPAISAHAYEVFAAAPDAILDLRSDGVISGGLVVIEWTLRTHGAGGGWVSASTSLHGVSLLVLDGARILEERVYPAGRLPG